MAYTYLSPQRDQLFLMPVSMRDWLEEGHLAWFIIDVVAELDTSAFDAIHPNDGAGRPAYDPVATCLGSQLLASADPCRRPGAR